MFAKLRFKGLLFLAGICVALAVWTMLPTSASKPNDLGYYSYCPFAPYSTLTLLLLAGFILVVRQYFFRREW
jgi:hypothetical protein